MPRPRRSNTLPRNRNATGQRNIWSQSPVEDRERRLELSPVRLARFCASRTPEQREAAQRTAQMVMGQLPANRNVTQRNHLHCNLDEFQETSFSEVQRKRSSTNPVEIYIGEEFRRSKRLKIEEELGTSNQTVKVVRKDIDPLIPNWRELLVYKIQELDKTTRKSAMLQIDELVHHIKMRTMIQKSMEASLPSLDSKDNQSSCEKKVSEDVGSNTPDEATNSDRLIESYTAEEIKIEYNKIELDEESVQIPLKLKEECLAESEFDAREIKIEYESESDSKEIKIDEEVVKIPLEPKEESLVESDFHAKGVKIECEEYSESDFREIEENEIKIDEGVVKILLEPKEESLVESEFNARKIKVEYQSDSKEIEYNEIKIDEEVVKIPLEPKEESLVESDFHAKGVKIECEEYSESDFREIEKNEIKIDEGIVKILLEPKEESLVESEFDSREIKIEYESDSKEIEIEYYEIEIDEEIVKIPLEPKEESLEESEFDAKEVEIECEKYSESDCGEIDIEYNEIK